MSTMFHYLLSQIVLTMRRKWMALNLVHNNLLRTFFQDLLPVKYKYETFYS